MKLIANLLRASARIPKVCSGRLHTYFPENGSILLIRRFLSSEGLPKHRVLNLPALSPTMENGNLVSWSVKEGDKVDEGDVLADIETDKAVVSYEIVDGGYVAKLLVEQGTKQIPLGTPVCILVDSPEDVEKFKGYTSGSDVGGATNHHSIQSGNITEPSDSSQSVADVMQVEKARDSPTREASNGCIDKQ